MDVIGKHITRFDARRCREANLTLPEARLLEATLSHRSEAELVKEFGVELVMRLERRGYIYPVNGGYYPTPDGFRALEKCFS
ncbi:MAG: hypothetical protein WHV66_00070 [Anaerolineales bacterium]